MRKRNQKNGRGNGLNGWRGVGIFLCGVLPAFAVEPVLERAQTALDKGWSSAVIFELEPEVIQSLPVTLQREALLLKGQAQLQAGDVSAARLTFNEERLAGDPLARYWMGQAEYAAKNYAAALTAYSAASGELALWGKARSLRALGRDKEAATVLSQIPLKSPVGLDAALELATIWLEWRNFSQTDELISQLEQTLPDSDLRIVYLRGVLDWQEGRLDPARESLAKAARDEGDTGALAVIALSQVEAAVGDHGAAEDVLEDYLRGTRGTRLLLRVMENLDALYQRRPEPSSSDLRAVREDASNPARANLAGYFLARNEVRVGRVDSAARCYEKFIPEAPTPELQARAMDEYADLLTQNGRANEAMTLLEKWPAPRSPRLQLRLGESLAAQSKYLEAEQAFLVAASADRLGEIATANAAMAALLAGKSSAENPGLQLLRKNYSSSNRLAELEVWLARESARRRSPDAPEQLEHLARIGNAEARLHLAEWRFINSNLPDSARELAKANIAGANGERAGYLAVFMADTGDEKSSDRARQLAEDFIKRFPQSPFIPEVEFKRGEILFARGDYVGARQAFRRLASEFPAAPLAGRAWLEAGQSGLRIMTQESLDQSRQDLEEAAKSDPSLAALARFYQALVQNALNQPREAIVLFDKVIETQQDPELKFAAWIEKGDTLNSLGKKDPAQYRVAIAAWNQVAADPSAPARWSNEALCKIGIASEKVGDQAAALKSFYAVLSHQKTGDEEFLWLYKSGFEAARILEKQKAWREAIAVYEDLAKMGGPRSEEARNRVNRLRLDNLIWAD